MTVLELSDAKKILKHALANGGQFAELYCENTLETQIAFEDKRVEDITSGANQGVGLRLIADLKTVYGFSNDFSRKTLIELATQLSAALKGHPPDRNIAFKRQEPITVFPVVKDPLAIATPEKIALCKRGSDFAWDCHPCIHQVQISYQESRRHVQIINSLGEVVEQKQQRLSFVVSVTVSDGKRLFTCHDAISGHCGFELFDEEDIFKLIRATSQRARHNLLARPAPAGRMPVVLSSAAGGTIIHEAVGHGLEADLVNNNMSLYRDKLGQKVAAAGITVIDDATLPKKNGSFSFDDEGVPSQKTILIENGILKNYMCDRLAALKMKRQPTGNGRRESYEYRPIVRMTNTLLAPGTDDPADILRSVDKGLFVKKMGGGQVNTVNGDFVFEVEEGYLIENGQIADPVKNASLVGNGPEILKSIDKIGNDLGFATGMCGKEDQSVPVTDAIPTIRIPEITVGGKVSIRGNEEFLKYYRLV